MNKISPSGTYKENKSKILNFKFSIISASSGASIFLLQKINYTIFEYLLITIKIESYTFPLISNDEKSGTKFINISCYILLNIGKNLKLP
jgi:hypothetical protein